MEFYFSFHSREDVDYSRMKYDTISSGMYNTWYDPEDHGSKLTAMNTAKCPMRKKRILCSLLSVSSVVIWSLGIRRGPGLRTRYSDYARDWTTLGLIPGGGKRLLFSPESPSRLKGPPHLLFSGFLRFLPGVKELWRDVYHFPPYSSKLRNEWSYTSSPTVCLHGSYRENFTFLPLSYV